MPYELKVRDIEMRKTTCKILFDRFKRQSFLHRIVTGDEKWIYFDNHKRKKLWVNPVNHQHCNQYTIHWNLHLARVSVVAYAKWRLSFNISECKQLGPYELLSTVRLTVAGKRIKRCLIDEWKRVREMCPLAHTHVER